MSLSYTWGKFSLLNTGGFSPSLTGFTISLNERINIGLSYSLPYKMEQHTDWMEETSSEEPYGTGRYYRGIECKKIHSINGGTGVNINDKLSLGLNLSFLIINYKEGTEWKDENEDITSRMFYGVQPAVGFQYKINQDVTTGITIRKGYADGDYKEIFEIQNGDTIGRFYSEDKTLPLFVSMGLNFQVNERLKILSSLDYTEWDGVSYQSSETVENPENADDVIRVHGGTEFKINKAFSTYLGVNFTPYQYGTAESDCDQIFISTGLGYNSKNIKTVLSISSSYILFPSLKKENKLYLTLTYE